MSCDETPSNNKDWYSEGLKFSCTGCGKCCTGAPGFVWVTEEEVQKMADFLRLTVKDFSIRYLRKVNGRLSLTEMKKNYDCVFLENNQCKVYEVRPTQCQTFPFWPHIVKSENAWEATSLTCEGINSEADPISQSTIKKELQRYIDAYGE